jgi:hypothetical protein
MFGLADGVGDRSFHFITFSSYPDYHSGQSKGIQGLDRSHAPSRPTRCISGSIVELKEEPERHNLSINEVKSNLALV